MIEAKWNHSSKPSLFEVLVDGKVKFSGTYKAGEKIFRELLEYEKAMKVKKEMEYGRAN
jgi:hypothetical protein